MDKKYIIAGCVIIVVMCAFYAGFRYGQAIMPIPLSALCG